MDSDHSEGTPSTPRSPVSLTTIPIQFFLPGFFERLCARAQALVLREASREHQAVHRRVVSAVDYVTGRLLPLWRFLPANLPLLDEKEQVEAIEAAVVAHEAAVAHTRQRHIHRVQSARVVVASLRRALAHSSSPFLASLRGTLEVAGLYAGHRIDALGSYLCTPLANRPLEVPESLVLSKLLAQCRVCELQETPQARNFRFPWVSALRLACDLLGLDAARCLRVVDGVRRGSVAAKCVLPAQLSPLASPHPQQQRQQQQQQQQRVVDADAQLFATFCLFFALFRARIIDSLGTSPQAYYSDLGEWSDRGWEGMGDCRQGTPHFVGPGGRVVSLVSPVVPVRLLVRVAMEVRDENRGQLFAKFML